MSYTEFRPPSPRKIASRTDLLIVQTREAREVLDRRLGGEVATALTLAGAACSLSYVVGLQIAPGAARAAAVRVARQAIADAMATVDALLAVVDMHYDRRTGTAKPGRPLARVRS